MINKKNSAEIIDIAREISALELRTVQRKPQPAGCVLALHKPDITGRLHNKANLNPKLEEK